MNEPKRALTLGTIGRFHFFEQAAALDRMGAIEQFWCDDPRVLTLGLGMRGRWLPGAGLGHRLMGPARSRQALGFLGRAVARAVRNRALVKINSAFALEAILENSAREVWVDHGSLDERWVASAMREEAARCGLAEAAEGGNHGSAPIRERQAEEFRLADGVIVASDLAKRSLVDQGVEENKVRVVRLGVDTARFRAEPRLPRKVFRILHAGPVNYNKGVHRLIDAFAGLGLPESELVIAGRAGKPGQERFQETARGQRVRFEPPVAQSALPGLFASCDVFVLASLADGFGLTVLQAMACELPVIVTSRCGCAEVLPGCHAAEIIPPGDTGALAGALQRAYDLRTEDRGRAARAWAVRLDWDAHARQLLTALQPQEALIAS